MSIPTLSCIRKRSGSYNRIFATKHVGNRALCGICTSKKCIEIPIYSMTQSVSWIIVSIFLASLTESGKLQYTFLGLNLCQDSFFFSSEISQKRSMYLCSCTVVFFRGIEFYSLQDGVGEHHTDLLANKVTSAMFCFSVFLLWILVAPMCTSIQQKSLKNRSRNRSNAGSTSNMYTSSTTSTSNIL